MLTKVTDFNISKDDFECDIIYSSIKNNVIKNFVKLKKGKYSSKKNRSKTNIDYIIRSNSKKKERCHLIPFFITNNNSDPFNIIGSSKSLNQDMCIFENTLKSMLLFSDLYYLVEARVNKDNTLIVKMNIYSSSKKLLLTHFVKDNKKHLFIKNIIKTNDSFNDSDILKVDNNIPNNEFENILFINKIYRLDKNIKTNNNFLNTYVKRNTFSKLYLSTNTNQLLFIDKKTLSIIPVKNNVYSNLISKISDNKKYLSKNKIDLILKESDSNYKNVVFDLILNKFKNNLNEKKILKLKEIL